MIGKEGIKYSLRNLKKSKERSFFTILSIFIGITTIFIFVSFGLGLFDYIDEISGGASADKVIIQAKGAAAPGLDTTFALTESDIRVINGVTGVYEATGSYFRVVKLSQKDEVRYSFIISYTPENPLILESFDIGVEKGKDLTYSDSGKVILGSNFQEDGTIFSKGYEVNDKIEIDDKDFRVSGFLESIGNPQDDSQVYINEEAFQDTYPDTVSYGMIIARVNKEQIDIVVERIEKALRKHKDQEEGKEDFYVQSYAELLEAYSGALAGIVGFIVIIAIISVIVAAINTANTMIAAVLERYKEIGILKAIGAKNSEILDIFLFESSFLGLIAGALGILAGFLITYAAKVLLINLGWSFLAPLYNVWLFGGCLAFAIITGAISGVAPAIRASRINTVDALRYE
jgi:putative ABC transport system permease protein